MQAWRSPRRSAGKIVSRCIVDSGASLSAYLVDVLALELGKELGEALLIGLDADGAEDLLDVRSGRRGVTTKGEEHVGCDVLHFDGFLRVGVR